jgi:hypothetical protein
MLTGSRNNLRSTYSWLVLRVLTVSKLHVFGEIDVLHDLENMRIEKQWGVGCEESPSDPNPPSCSISEEGVLPE